MRVLLFLAFGLIIGGVVRLVLPGRSPRGWATSMLIGAAGSMVGGLLASGLGLNVEGQRSGFLISILGALAWLAIYDLIRRRAGSALGHPHAHHDDASEANARAERAARRASSFRPRGTRPRA
jgi:uncharacterized membrane protein YeaQ/YmgE (transglycosylase-associated protein family)